MFITMFMATIIFKTPIYVSSAGHEPGFYYSCRENKFYDLNAKGLVLGISSNYDYEQYEQNWILAI
ncbi:SpoIIE family protein phosphatase [Bacillus licheniformis]|nr:SpoIIE family protein phosphatase [Bacillus licheniformis]